ncbi:SDR family oxidoreductase [Peteryoungia ipomoeae]|uniref:SDR family oxidoreductase n=1 Tax=Peteryoungia ipomoeae TaxID=1210932 RepID=A0A4S8NSB8_9HYPH|nr:SDR family NAD(P)-dependent oxidoreductase [Peteryoungia ipomoeae]THV20263.1 SDR family oxidoreductase [Peteryoungia ipomoeae]
MSVAKVSRSGALVTGAGSGIGRAAAVRLAADGLFVGLLGRTENELEDALAEIRASGGDGMILTADVSREDEMRSALGRFATSVDQIKVLVVNAGINGTWAPIDELMPDEFDQTVSINLRGTYLTLHYGVPHMKQSGGSIVVVSSINGTRTFTSPGASAYSATKAAQLAMVQQLAVELGKHKIRINAVCPGAISTNIDDNTEIRSRAEAQEPVQFPDGDIPLTDGNPGRTEDIAAAIAFLASDHGAHITGTPIWIDGGQSLLR